MAYEQGRSFFAEVRQTSPVIGNSSSPIQIPGLRIIAPYTGKYFLSGSVRTVVFGLNYPLEHETRAVITVSGVTNVFLDRIVNAQTFPPVANQRINRIERSSNMQYIVTANAGSGINLASSGRSQAGNFIEAEFHDGRLSILYLGG